MILLPSNHILQRQMRSHIAFIGIILMGILLMSCTAQKSSEWPAHDVYEQNPLTAEVIADQMIDYATNLQINAGEREEKIKDPVVLRAIDDAFVEARNMQKRSHEAQDEGKIGALYGVNGNFAKGEVLLLDDMLYFGYWVEVSAAPKMSLYLAEHVSPHKSKELFSEAVRKIDVLHSPYGAQQYSVGTLKNDEWNKFRTVAIYSESLKQVIALAQIRGAVK